MRLAFTGALAAAIALVLAAPPAQTRIMRAHTCTELLSGSELIVVARPVSKTTDTAERTEFRDICERSGDNPCAPVPAVGVETKFQVLQVLKGDNSLKALNLHHYREAGGASGEATEIDGPATATFDPRASTKSGAFLLFLTQESDGRYAPYGGQTDPSAFSIYSLEDASRVAKCDTTSGRPQCRIAITAWCRRR